MMDMDLDSCFNIATEVQTRHVGDELVMLDLKTGTYFGLDTVGRRFWDLLSNGASLRQICNTLIEEFDTTLEVLERDTLVLAHNLADKNLILPA